MKLLFVLEHYHPYIGGAEYFFSELTSSLAKRGHDVRVITTHHRSDLPKREIWNGVKIIRVPCFNRFLFTLFSLPYIVQQARHCHFIHTTTYTAALPAWLVSKLLGKKVLLTFHEVWTKLWWKLPFISYWERQLYYLFEQFILQLPFHHYTAVSHYTKNSLVQAGISAERVSMIYNGLDYQGFQTYKPMPPSNFVYTYFGRLGISKGLDVLLPAAKLFYIQHPSSKLQLIIPKTPKAILKKVKHLIKQLQLEKHILLKHNLSKPTLYHTLCQSSCVVIPSHSEGFCFAAAEASALKIPIISSQKGALSEVVNGRYLPIELLDKTNIYDALLKAKKGQWNELPIKKFPLENTVQQYLELYEFFLDTL